MLASLPSFIPVTSLHVWLTVSSLINKDANNHKSLIFRQIELNWINAPLDYETDYIGLYLDSVPGDRSMPVSVHRLAGQTSGHIVTDFFLPQLNLLNETVQDLNRGKRSETIVNGDGSIGMWNEHHLKRHDDQELTRGPAQLSSQCLGYCLAYHSRNKILASNCLRTNPTWMQDSFRYIGSRSLPQLMIPGSHNSATYPKVLDKSALNMINKYQMNQDEPVFNQLMHGIRHLDLRVGYSKVKQRPERFWIYHDIFRTDIAVDEILDQVRKFLDLTSHEVIIMDLHRFTVGFQNENQATQRERHAKLIELIYKKVGSFIIPSYLGQHAPLNELVAAGKRLVVGYAARSMILGSNELSILGQLNEKSKSSTVRDIDAPNQDQEDSSMDPTNNKTVPLAKQKPAEPDKSTTVDRRFGSSLFSKLKSLKIISRTFSKRSLNSERFSFVSDHSYKRIISDSEPPTTTLITGGANNEMDATQSLAKVALFFPPVRHLWPDKDTIEGLAQYMNDTTCRKYFGELRSMMVELTPTVFGAISDKYDGNRRLAQQVNRPVTDWIRDRWLHCINIVASDYILGNDLIQLSIYANKMRAHQSRDAHSLSSSLVQCPSFLKIGHLLDKSKIPVQFTFHQPKLEDSDDTASSNDMADRFARANANEDRTNPRRDNDLIAHTSSNGNRIFLKPVKAHKQHSSSGRERRDSFVDNFSDGFTNLFSSFKRLLNL